MANRLPQTPALGQVTANLQESLGGLQRALYRVLTEILTRGNLAFVKDGTEAFEAPLPLQQTATADLPPAADHKGKLVYDLTTNTVKFSNGTTWTAL